LLFSTYNNKHNFIHVIELSRSLIHANALVDISDFKQNAVAYDR
jgi:hypothetical protein